jgi:hypothetical protein
VVSSVSVLTKILIVAPYSIRSCSRQQAHRLVALVLPWSPKRYCIQTLVGASGITVYRTVCSVVKAVLVLVVLLKGFPDALNVLQGNATVHWKSTKAIFCSRQLHDGIVFHSQEYLILRMRTCMTLHSVQIAQRIVVCSYASLVVTIGYGDARNHKTERAGTLLRNCDFCCPVSLQ